MEESKPLAARRSRRSTAGNRMELALAEFAKEDAAAEPEDDNDFEEMQDEEEIFDSDFMSTDEEDAQDEGTSEKGLQEEEKQARRMALRRTKVVLTARSYPINSKSPPKAKKCGRRRRVSMGNVLDAETGEVIDTTVKRQSRRKSTILNSQGLQTRLKDAEDRRASMPKKIKEVTYQLSQAELIARALDTEEVNIMEHRSYLSQEEEKRRRARIIRKTISGPLLRWISKKDSEKITPENPSPSFAFFTPTISNFKVLDAPNYPQSNASQSAMSVTTPPQPYNTPLYPGLPSATAKTVEVTKNYLVHELGQFEGVEMPDWESMMSAVFGDHADWANLKVFTGKHRPLHRPMPKCPVTGKAALYRDRRTGVPYANVTAYKILSQLLEHKYIWNSELGSYTASAGEFNL